MNKLLSLIRNLAALAILASSATALPASADNTGTAALSLRGAISPAACTPRFTNGGKIDFGTVHLGELERGPERTKVGERRFNFHVTCDDPATVYLIVHDNQAGTAMSRLTRVDKQFHYGLGKSGKRRVGTYLIYLSPTGAEADGKPVGILASDDGRNTWVTPELSFASPNLQFGWPTGGGLVPGAFTTLSMTVLVTVYLPPEQSISMDDEIVLNGLSTFEIKYM